MPSLIILTGGRGRRLGGIDKARLQLHDQSFLTRIVDRLGPHFDEVLLAGSAVPPQDLPGARVVPDRHPGGGPLQGLAAGLAAMAGPIAFVCACDMPMVRPEVVRRLLHAQGPHAAVVPRIDGRPQFLHAVYGRACLPIAAELAGQPGIPVARLLDRVDCLWLDPASLEGLPFWRESFLNVNSPADLSALLARLEGTPTDPGTTGRAAPNRPDLNPATCDPTFLL